MRGVQRGEPLCRESEGQKQVLPLPARNKAERIAERKFSASCHQAGPVDRAPPDGLIAGWPRVPGGYILGRKTRPVG